MCRRNIYETNWNSLFSIIRLGKGQTPISVLRMGTAEDVWMKQGTVMVLSECTMRTQQRCFLFNVCRFASWDIVCLLYKRCYVSDAFRALVIIHMIAVCAFVSNLDCKPYGRDYMCASLTDLKYTLFLRLYNKLTQCIYRVSKDRKRNSPTRLPMDRIKSLET